MLCIALVIVFLSGIESARILGVFPAPSISHQVVFNTYMQELVKQGHDVVVITPNPTQPKYNPMKNLTEIDISYLYTDMAKTLNAVAPFAKRGVVMEADTMFKAQFFENIVHIIAKIFEDPQVQSIIRDKNQRFDLIVLEAFTNYHLIASNFFNAPVIFISSFYGLPDSFEVLGAIGSHPKLYPSPFRNKFGDLSIWETIRECYNEYKVIKKFRELEVLKNALLKHNFGSDTPTVKELKNNVALLFLNAHPLFADNRPVPPGVIFLGALHLKPIKELPKDLKSYLDESKTGVVYVSFGSNVRPELMHKDLLDAFLDAFEALPYDVLWKYDGNLERQPKNLKVQKWFPQRDLLVHPNVKVFVTQGGLQSTDEAIDAGVPLVGIPMLGDQPFNTNKYVQLGIGLQLDALTLTANDLMSAVKAVASDGRANIKHLKEIMNDQPQRPLERAVWWTEHVLRHGAAHLRSPAANISWAEYLMFDVFIPVFVILIVLIIIAFILVAFALKSLHMAVSAKKAKVKSN